MRLKELLALCVTIAAGLIILGCVLLVLAGCGNAMQAPPPDQTVGSVGQLVQAPTAAPQRPTNVPAGYVSPYEGDRANSVTVQAGDVLTIHQPDYPQSYTLRIESVSTTGIIVATDDPNVEIRDNGSAMVRLFDKRYPNMLGYDVPIGFARFTPLEHTPVVQTYSMQPGGTVAKEGDDL